MAAIVAQGRGQQVRLPPFRLLILLELGQLPHETAAVLLRLLATADDDWIQPVGVRKEETHFVAVCPLGALGAAHRPSPINGHAKGLPVVGLEKAVSAQKGFL